MKKTKVAFRISTASRLVACSPQWIAPTPSKIPSQQSSCCPPRAPACGHGDRREQWTGAYDASGDLTCRAPSSATTCTGTQPGAQLSYDVEGRLWLWQASPNNYSNYAGFLYDGAGQRVEQMTGTSTTVYIGNLEAVRTTGATTTTTTYYYGAGRLLAEAVNGTVSYLATTVQGSIAAALSASGTTTAAQLYAPYGTSRFSSGTMPTDYGYTGQRADAATYGGGLPNGEGARIEQQVSKGGR
jgi:hypothetical protein